MSSNSNIIIGNTFKSCVGWMKREKERGGERGREGENEGGGEGRWMQTGISGGGWRENQNKVEKKEMSETEM